jgi:HD-GYP domain-containing protein (c-di-GMP phosphodiesterase class II)
MPVRTAIDGKPVETDAASDLKLRDRVNQLTQIGVALSKETNIQRLLETILLVAKHITNADGGTIYRVTEDRSLKFEIVHTDSLGLAMGGTTGVEIPFYPVRLYDKNNHPITSNVVAYAYHHDKSLNIANAYAEDGFDFSGTKSIDKKTGYHSQSFLTVPMKNHENEIIGVLQLLNKMDPRNGTIAFTEEDQRFAESLASQAAIVLTNRLLIDHLERLFESFINMINASIDDKSPYTGKHCDRVPVLTMMLANAVTDCRVGPFKEFSMSEKDRYELKIAGLLHDCGKITTPEHVVDKATKLQTIYDRIGTIDTRFEVIKRDAEILALEAKLDALQSGDLYISLQIDQDLELRLAEINDDREFLRFCNRGCEAMSPDDVQRVKRISAKYRWKDANGNLSNFLTDDEITNLTIRSGTLTAAERQIINHHIDVTIHMLEALPWPKHLKKVPEYAGGHHERMDGTGYPRGLRREDMSVQARCMGIADVFEALTAEDRPYKQGKTLSESLQILGQFKLNGQIDPDLFNVFIWEKVYLKYAHQFMDPIRIDEVDLSKIPGYEPQPVK